MIRQAPEWFGGNSVLQVSGDGPSTKSPRSSSRSGRSRKSKDGVSSSSKSHRRRKSKDDSSNISDARTLNKEQQQQSQKQGGSKNSTSMSPDPEALSYSQKNKGSSIKNKGGHQIRNLKLTNNQHSQLNVKIPQALTERQQMLNNVSNNSLPVKSKNLAERFIGGFQRLAKPHQYAIVSPSRNGTDPLNNTSSTTTDQGGEIKRVRVPRSTPTTEGSDRKDSTSHYEKKYPMQQHSSTMPLQDIHLTSRSEISFRPNNNFRLKNEDLIYSDDEHTNAVRPPCSSTPYQSPQSLRGINPNTQPYCSPYEPVKNHETYNIRRQDEIILLARQGSTNSTFHHDPQSSAHPPSYGAISGNDMYLSDSSSDMLPDSHLKKNKYVNPQIPGMILEEDGHQILSSESDPDDNVRSCSQSYDPGEHSEQKNDSEQQRRRSLRSLDNLNMPILVHVNQNEEACHGSGKVMLNISHNTSSSSEGTHNGAPPLSTLLIPSSNHPQQRQTLPPLPTVLFTNTSPRASIYSTQGTEATEMSSRRFWSKKERRQQKKQQLLREHAEIIEDRVQSIVREGHFDDLDWSRHVPQKIGSINRATGFFSKETAFKTSKDRPFAFLFLLQLCAITYIAIQYGGLTVMSIVSSVNTEITSNATPSSNDPFSTQNNPFTAPQNDPFSATVDSKSGTQDPFSTVGTGLGPSSTKLFWNKNILVSYGGAFNLACIAALQAISLALLVVMIMMILNTALIQTFLLAIITATLCFSVIGIVVSPYNIIPVLGLIGLALSSGYCIVVWDRVPFATTNMRIALNGMKCTADILMVAFGMMMVAFLWSLLWAVSFLGIYDVFLSTKDAHNDQNSVNKIGVVVYFGMIFSYIWTYNVIKNIVHVTVAGVVATWWSNPDSLTSCCSSSLREQFAMAITTSFGSICLGSLLSPPAFILQNLSSICTISLFNTGTHSIISERDTSSSRTIDSVADDNASPLDGIPHTKSPFDRILNYCSDFGFTYVGIYRESYMTGSKKATDVFTERGWMGVVSDQLIPNILKIATVLIALVTGLFTFIVEDLDGYQLTNYQGSAGSTAFVIGCSIGLVLSSICLKVVGSSVNTILVCFSVAPFVFRHHHPGLSGEMRHAWGGTWLDDLEAPDQYT